MKAARPSHLRSCCYVHVLDLVINDASNGGSRPGVWGGQSNRGRQTSSLIKYPWLSVTIVGYHINMVIFWRLKRWQFLLVELC